MHRNEILHNSDNTLDKLHGKPLLIEAIKHELNLGKDGLHQNFSPFFSFFPTQQIITDTDTDLLRNWFRIIRKARENNISAHKDVFSYNGPLRKWVGLPPINC
jgi:hypothetical protein